MASPISSPSLRSRSLMSVGKKQLVVTGGAGLIGRNLVAALNHRGEENMVVVDRLGTSDKWKNLQGLAFDDFVDIDDFRERVRESGVSSGSTVIHLGAISDTTERDADTLIDNNTRYTRELCDACLKAGARFIYASGASTYGAGECGFFDNDHTLSQLRPLSVAAASKHLFDLWALRNGHLGRIAGLKFFSTYGPGEDHKGDRRSIILKAFEQIEATGAVTLYKSTRPDCADGEQQRDFIHVKDAVAATLFLYDKPDINGLFNCGTGTSHTFIDAANAVFAALGKEPRINFVDMPEAMRPGYQVQTHADISRLRTAGFTRALMTFDDGVKDYVQKYLLPRADV